MRRSLTAWKLSLCLISLGSVLPLPATAADLSAPQKTLIEWRFDADDQFRGWTPNADLADVAVRDGRLRGRVTGSDPVLLGPVFELAATPTQQVEIRIKSSQAGAAELFWTETLTGRFGGFSQQKTVRFSIAGDGQLHVYRLRPFWHKAGHVVRLRFDPPADAVFEIDSLRIVDDVRPTRSPARAWRFRNSSHGWRPDRGLVNFSVDAGGLGMTTAVGNCTLVSPLVDLDAAPNPFVSLRMSVSAGVTGSIYCASSDQVGWHSVGFAVRADGRMHTYNVEVGTLAAWSGRIIMLGVEPSDAAGAAVVVESIEVAAEPQGPAELLIDYLGPATGVNRAGRPVEIVCQVRNLGGQPAVDVTATLSVPGGVKFIGPATRAVDPVSLYLPRQVTWTVEAQQAGSAAIGVRLESPGGQPATAAATVHFTPVPRLSAAADRAGGGSGQVPEPRPVPSNYDIGAFYFPGWPDLGRWRPIFDFPMRKPVLGWYDEANPQCADWQIKWAVEHGITFFMVDWYWSQGSRQLEHWLHDAYMKARHRKYLKWAVMWANHNRPGTHSAADWQKVTQYWIDHYLGMEEYYRIDGRPAVFIWAPANIRRDLGGSEQAAGLYAMSQRMARQAGLPGIYFVAMSGHESAAGCRQLKAEGYEAFTSYHAFQRAAAQAGSRDFGFAKVVETSPEVWREADARAAGLQYFPLIETGWDSRPWHKNKARVIHGRTPALFGQLCAEARKYADRTGKRIITVAPWNEWGEGSYIEPYAEYGFGDLDALRAAFCPAGDYPPNVIPADVGLGPYDLPPVALKSAWEFNTDGDSEGWSLAGQIDAEVRGGLLVGRSTGGDPILSGPPVQLEAARTGGVVFRARCDRADRAQLFWGTHISAVSAAQSVLVDLVGDGEFHEYRVDLSSNVRWRGVITSLRFDPVAGAGARFALDYIRFQKQNITIMDPAQARVDLPVPVAPNPIVVDNRKRLFADDWVIERMDGLTRTLHPLKKHPGNPLFRAEMPWEKPCVLLYGSVMYDPHRQDDRFRMWYLCFTCRYNDDYSERLEKSGRIAYAVSRDGLHWQRPNLGLFEYQGNTRNNIVIPGPWGVASIHYDPRDPDPQRRYKAQVRYNGHRAYFSPDGIHWTQRGPMNLSAFDRSTVHWHPVEGKWFASTKNWYKVPGAEDQRGRGYAESGDFLDWGPVSYMCGTPPESGEIVYGLEPFYYESMFFGQWDRYRREPDGLLDVQLAVSHNGRHWQRPSAQAWIPLTPLPENFPRRTSARSPETGVDPLDPRVPWDYANNSGSILGPIRVGDELWLYYSGRTTDHRSRPQVGSIGLGTLRLDGFFSLDAGPAKGTLVTRPLRLAGAPLHVNANADGGELRVAVVAESGAAIQPFTLENCLPLTTDSVRHQIAWQGTPPLAPLGDRVVRLKFQLQRARLYAFWTGAERPWDTPDTTTWHSSAGGELEDYLPISP